MNYEEMLNAREGMAVHREQLPIGWFYKKLIDKKYRNVVELKPMLVDNILFCEGIKADYQNSSTVTDAGQLHYEIHTDSSGMYELELEQGNIVTMAQLIDNNPAVVTTSGFVDKIVQALLDVTIRLHERGIYHLCYAPQEVFLHKGSSSPMLLCHGSSFAAMSQLSDVYVGFEQFIAPEVLSDHAMGDQQDVYALGRFIEWLFQHGELPFEYKRLVAKATQQRPEDRYASVVDMKADLGKKRNIKRSFLSFVAAFAVVLLLIGLYFELMPQTSEMEFVEGVSKSPQEDPFEKGFNMETEMGLWVDSVDTLSEEERAQMDEYQRKAEEIFRKQYTREADRIISKLYSKQGMSLSENVFIASSNAMTEELTKTGEKLANDAGISIDKALRIAAEVNDALTSEKEKNLVLMGAQKGEPKD